MPPQSTRTSRDPFTTLHWWVEINGITVASFAECSGLSMETEMVEYRAGGKNEFTLKFPGATKHSNLVLKRGFTDDKKLWDWYQSVVQLGQKGSDIRKTVTVMLYDLGKESSSRRWTLLRAFPVKWVGPEFRADQASIAIETLELAFEGFSMS